MAFQKVDHIKNIFLAIFNLILGGFNLPLNIFVKVNYINVYEFLVRGIKRQLFFYEVVPSDLRILDLSYREQRFILIWKTRSTILPNFISTIIRCSLHSYLDCLYTKSVSAWVILIDSWMKLLIRCCRECLILFWQKWCR